MTRWLCAALLTLSTTAHPAELTVNDPQVAEASAAALVFMSRMKPQLKQALQSGPPAQALAVCAEVAPQIAAELSAETGWSVKRVSLRPRNPQAAADAWETEQLEAFDAAVAAGGNPGWAAAEVNGEVRFLAPQRVGGACLLCHGESIDADTAAALKRLYPEDRAIGYQPGQVRGAISLSTARRDPPVSP